MTHTRSCGQKELLLIWGWGIQTPDELNIQSPNETPSNDSNVFEAFRRVGALIRWLMKELFRWTLNSESIGIGELLV